VGSIIRAADAFGCAAIHLLGITPQPDQAVVLKTAKNAEKTVSFQYWFDGEEFLQKGAKPDWPIYALETSSQSRSLWETRFRFPCYLVFGHEVMGVSESFLSQELIAIPMLGIKNSLNVAVAAGIAMNTLAQQYSQ